MSISRDELISKITSAVTLSYTAGVFNGMNDDAKHEHYTTLSTQAIKDVTNDVYILFKERQIEDDEWFI